MSVARDLLFWTLVVVGVSVLGTFIGWAASNSYKHPPAQYRVICLTSNTDEVLVDVTGPDRLNVGRWSSKIGDTTISNTALCLEVKVQP